MNLPTPTTTDIAIEEAMALLAMLAARFESDRPIADRLHLCRKDLDQQLQARRWNAYAAMVTARSERSALKRRHQARAGGVARA